MKKIKKHLISLLFLASANTVALSAESAPGGSLLRNQVTISFQDIAGNSYTTVSNVVDITIREVQAATLTEVSGTVQEVAAIPQAEVDSVHRLQNTGNVSSTYQLTAANVTATGAKSALTKSHNKVSASKQILAKSLAQPDTINADVIQIFHDNNANGQVDVNETTPITEITLVAGETANLIVRSQLPDTVTEDDRLDVTLQAQDKDNGAVTTSINQVYLTFTESNAGKLLIWNEAEGGNCHAYKIVAAAQAISWTQAKSEADRLIYRGVPGHLVSITSGIEQQFIYSLINRFSQSYWMGLSRPEHTAGSYQWVTGEALSYGNWGVSEPSLGTQHYALMWHGGEGKWYDKGNQGDGIVRHYIVEFDADCGHPKIDIQLTAAKDLNCDDNPDSDFGMIKLSEMEGGQCVMMDIAAINDSGTAAKNVQLFHELKPYTSYRAESLSLCKGVGCQLITKTPASADADGGEILENEGKLVFSVGDLELNEQAHARFSVKID